MSSNEHTDSGLAVLDAPAKDRYAGEVISTPGHERRRRVEQQVVDVVYDMCFFGRDSFSGITRVFDELLPRMADNGIQPHLLLDHRCQVGDYPQARRLKIPTRYSGPPWRMSYPRARRLYKRDRARLLRSCPDAVFHSTFFTDSEPVNLPEVLYIHDMIPELFPEYFDDEAARQYMTAKARCAARASRIVCVSENTRNDVIRLYDVDPSHICVVRNAVGACFHAAARDGNDASPPSSLPGRYFVYVGSRAHYKGFWTLVRAVRSLPESMHVHVVCVGAGTFNDLERAALYHLDAEDVVSHAGFVADEQLIAMYRHSCAVVVPSYYEGFGLVAAEAATIGAPLICADTPALHEAAGDGADHWFPPGNVDALADCLADMCDSRRDTAMRYDAPPAYTWDDAAMLLADVYRQVHDDDAAR